MYKFITLVFLLTITTIATANRKIADSLNYEIINTQNAVEKANLQLDYCWEIKYEDFDKCLSTTKTAIAVLERANNKEGIAKGLSYMGVYMYLQDSLPEAILYLEKAEKMLLTQDNPKLLARVYNNFGVFYSSLFDNETALKFYKKSLDIKERTGDSDISSNLINISSILYDQGNYQECIETNEQALIYSLKNDDYEMIAVIYSNLGAANERLGNYTIAINYTLKALDLYQNTVKNEADEARTYSNLGANYLSQNKVTEAKYYFNVALDINKRINHQSNIAVSNNNLAEVERKLKNYDTAMKHALAALQIANDLNYVEEKRISYEELSLITEDQGDFESSLKYFKKYVAISDSITKINQTDEVRKTLSQNQLSLKKIQEKQQFEFEKVQDKKILIMYGFMLSAMVFLIVWLLNQINIIALPKSILNAANYLIPVLITGGLIMYVLLATKLPSTLGVVQNFIIIIGIIILGLVTFLLFNKYSFSESGNGRS